MVGFEIKITGIDRTTKNLRRIRTTAPAKMDFISRGLAQDVKMGARKRLSRRTRPDSGAALKSIEKIKQRNGVWVVTSLPPVGNTYFRRLEEGTPIIGYTFIPAGTKLGGAFKAKGGRRGEGIALPGGSGIPIGTGKFSGKWKPHSLRDAAESTRRRVKKIVDREIDKWVRQQEARLGG